MTKKTKTKKVAINLRLQSAEELEKIKTEAKKDSRSINSWCRINLLKLTQEVK